MNILFVTGLYPRPNHPQYGSFNHEMAKALHQSGKQISVIVPLPIHEARALTAHTTQLEGIPVTYLPYPGTGSHLGTLHGKILAARLAPHIDRLRPDIIHTHFPLYEGEAIRIISQKQSIPYIVHVHSLDAYGERLSPRLRPRCETTYRHAAAIVCVSRRAAQNLNPKKTHIIPNGVNPRIFYPLPNRQPAFHNPLRLITAGNLIPLKGHHTTLHALASLRDSGHPATLRIFGRGPQEKQLRRLTATLNLQDRVTFEGYQPPERFAQALRASDIFVLPSTYEAFGCVYLEALATALPAIACQGCGITDVADISLIPPNDSQALALAILQAHPLSAPLIPITWENAAQRLRPLYTIAASGELD